MKTNLWASTLVILRMIGFAVLASATCGIAHAVDSCVPYFDSDPKNSPDQAVHLPPNTALYVSYSRVTGQEKSTLTIFQNLKAGGWGIIVSPFQTDATGWGSSIGVGPQPIPADSMDRFFSATAVFSNPGDGKTYPTAYGRLCTRIDPASNTVTQAYLVMTPHVENDDDFANTVVYFTFSPAIPNLQYRTGLKLVALKAKPKKKPN
jgi:hypothetical protein